MSSVRAIEGGTPIVRTPIKPRNAVTSHQVQALQFFMADAAKGLNTLSGYLAGSKRGGSAVQRLEDLWCEQFSVQHAIACNSGTSALLAACAAAEVRRNTHIVVPTMGMSAAAAAPQLLGGDVRFADVDEHFQLAPEAISSSDHVIIAINLFGRPCRLPEILQRGNRFGAILIEDACQSLWATINGKLTAGTAHISCYSMNVHKPCNAGEGGMAVTNDAALAARLRGFVNHGECQPYGTIGLNLRMTELTAVLALSQLENSKRVVERCRAIYGQLSRVKDDTTGITFDCYALPLLAPTARARDYLVKALNAEGVPCRSGYTMMHKLPVFGASHIRLLKAEDYVDRMVLIELCSLDPTDEQVEQMAAAINTVWQTLW